MSYFELAFIIGLFFLSAIPGLYCLYILRLYVKKINDGLELLAHPRASAHNTGDT